MQDDPGQTASRPLAPIVRSSTMSDTNGTTVTATAPEGFHFEYEEVKTDRGQKSLGNVPILVADSVEAAIALFGEEGVKNILDGTSLRVSYQGIARRMRAAGKTDD